MEGNAKVIAVTGKGGVGKTSLAAALVRSLTEKYQEAKILAIDADPAVGLATALDVEVKETLDDIRLEITSGVSDKLKETQDILSEARFRLLDMMDEKEGFAFVAIGRPESSGCYCAVNSYLRDVDVYKRQGRISRIGKFLKKRWRSADVKLTRSCISGILICRM